MRHFRNPRFAPESLERKLNPSTPVGLTVVVEVAPVANDATIEMASEVDSTSKAPTVDYGSLCRTEDAPPSTSPTPSYPRPGDAGPLVPTTNPDPSGTGGTPPPSDPSNPGGGTGNPG